jgi:hypothetical protein
MNAQLCKERFKKKNTVDPSHFLILRAQILRSDFRRKAMFKLLLTIGEFPPRSKLYSIDTASNL